jgi:hypothetical protein
MVHDASLGRNRRSLMASRVRPVRRHAAALRASVCAGWFLIAPLPGHAVEQPVVWRDPDTGCAYLLGPQGGIAPRYLRDGSPDCPDARAGSRFIDETARGLAQGLDALKREVERLRQRFQDPERREERL